MTEHNHSMFSITPLAECHFEGLHAVLDVVAREKRYLALTQAPPLAESVSFYRNLLREGFVAMVVLIEGEVSGWCDVLRPFGEARRHIGTLGIGLLPSIRHRGIGRPLLEAAIGAAWERGFERIELTVRCDNRNACALYERVGFAREGQHRRAFCIDGDYFDVYSMGLLRQA